MRKKLFVKYINMCAYNHTCCWRELSENPDESALTHWSRVTHICDGNLIIIGPDNGLSPGRRQAIIGTYAGILLIGPWGTNFSEILIDIQAFSLKKIRLKISSAICCSFRLGPNVLNCSHISNDLRYEVIDFYPIQVSPWRVFHPSTL